MNNQMTNTERQETKAQTGEKLSKKPYSTPKLVVYGNIEQVTKTTGNMGPAMDAPNPVGGMKTA